MRKSIFIAAVLSLALTGQTSAAEKRSIDSFDDGDRRTEQDGWWYSYDDSKKGGNSQCTPGNGAFKPTKGEDGQGWAARLAGLTGTKLGWDFCGMGFTLSSDSGCPVSNPVDISRYTTLEFKMRGSASAGRLTVVIPYTENNKCEGYVPFSKTAWADYQTAVTSDLNQEWTTVRLNLREDFSQPSWTKPEHKVSIEEVLRDAHVIQWHFSSADGDTVDLWIDDVVLY